MPGLLSDVLPAVYGAGDWAKKQVNGLLDDQIYPVGNWVKGRVNSIISDPVGDIKKTLAKAGNDLNQLGLLSQQAYGDTKDPLKVTDPQAARQLANTYLGAVMNFAPAGITVWHGSPHTFSKFDASKIGTGEGAQAYGHGLYVAESPSVAKDYQKTLSADGFLVGDKVFDPSTLQHMNVKVAARKGDLEAAIAKAKEIANGNSPVASMAAQDLARLQEIKSAGGMKPNTGSLYKVDLPDEHVAKMLDWDKPLTQQHPEVQKALSGAQMQDAISKLKASGELADYSASDMAKFKGEDFYDFLRQANGDSNVAPSQFLQQQGIPGIRYLDGGSRGVGAGTSNFVIFPGNEGLLSILERNGVPIKP